MKIVPRRALLLVAVAAFLLPSAQVARADEESVGDRLRKLESLVREQQEEIQRLRQGLSDQQAASDTLASELDRFLAKAEDESFWQQANTMRAFWKDGLKFETADGQFKFGIFGRVYTDWGFYDENFDQPKPEVEPKLAPPDTDYENNVKFRTARLGIEGTIYTDTEIKAEVDFAGGTNAMKDVYMGFRAVPVFGAIRIGHFKEPFSLEEVTSSRFITFMERGLPNVFAPSRNAGVMLHDSYFEDRLNYGFGLFHTTDDTINGRTDPSLTGRLAGRPWVGEDPKTRFLHVGAAASWRRQADDKWRWRQRPEIGIIPDPRIVDTGDFTAEHALLLGLEAALVYGPFSLQGEYMVADMDSDDFDDPRFDGFYVFASFFITGESRAYKGAAFNRVKPAANFHDPAKPGPGAVEIALRYSSLDLTDEAIVGGEIDDFTLGLTWYVNPHVRFMLNYIMSDVEDLGDLDVFAVRAQFDF